MLTEKRKADRLEMVRRLTQAALDAGAHTESRVMDREHWLTISAPGGLRVTITLDGASSQPDVHVIPWHMDTNSARKLSRDVFRDVNPYHGRKCTEVRHGFEPLLERVVECVRAAVEGRAYA